ncbi:glucosamine-6-phosphate deaminase [Thermaerobacter subterraneus]|uniref:6-phosphogluconolactonase/glucosamine-6-phosphate isomerase/deaminase n=1 Tax=Thermaerobacter subterraneus DSM 13965 TaxID=867903 RepID=K6Q036_9FIRM|nr:glucosamine-6-phosphate deaminase [Thermaerobacter subterraneus]EKP94239.1 6-phosphogluconolactonase/glucosamine-6-phosphate isomerase/deaminase [Thermaerobacter subterraneus DSM 13965]
MPPRIRIAESYEAMSAAAAEAVARRLAARPSLRMLLPTGHTPLGMYRRLVEITRHEGLRWDRAQVFLLDEYLGLGPEDPGSFRRYMAEHLLRHLNPAPAVDSLNGRAADPGSECARYEQALAAAGLDLVVLGIGRNGHIGFNEPGSPFTSRTRVVTLTADTRRANAPDFGGDPEAVPPQALTVGIATILEGKEIFVLAAGAAKAPAVERAIQGPLDPAVPASALQRHPRVTWFLDREAAAGLDPELVPAGVGGGGSGAWPGSEGRNRGGAGRD